MLLLSSLGQFGSCVVSFVQSRLGGKAPSSRPPLSTIGGAAGMLVLKVVSCVVYVPQIFTSGTVSSWFCCYFWTLGGSGSATRRQQKSHQQRDLCGISAVLLPWVRPHCIPQGPCPSLFSIWQAGKRRPVWSWPCVKFWASSFWNTLQALFSLSGHSSCLTHSSVALWIQMLGGVCPRSTGW